MKATRINASSYKVKALDPGDLDRAIEIWSLAFGFSDRDRWALFYDSFLDTAVGAYLDDYLVSIVGVINFQMWFGERLLPCAGVSAVAADPGHRRRGLIRQCLKEALKDSLRKRVPLAALWPFSYPFYKRMGFEVADRRYIIETPASVLLDSGDARNYRQIDLERYDLFKPIHDEWIKGNNLSLKRGDLQWRRLLSHPDRQICGFVHQEGYMLWNTKDKQSRILDVFEWAWLSEQAFLDGLSLLRRMDDLNWDKVRWQMCDLSPLIRMGISNPQPHITVKPGVMARVLHSSALMEALDIEAPPFAIDDPLSLSEAYRSGGTLTLGPGELIQYLTGFLPAKKNAGAGSIPQALAGKINYCAEFF